MSFSSQTLKFRKGRTFKKNACFFRAKSAENQVHVQQEKIVEKTFVCFRKNAWTKKEVFPFFMKILFCISDWSTFSRRSFASAAGATHRQNLRREKATPIRNAEKIFIKKGKLFLCSSIFPEHAKVFSTTFLVLFNKTHEIP